MKQKVNYVQPLSFVYNFVITAEAIHTKSSGNHPGA